MLYFNYISIKPEEEKNMVTRKLGNEKDFFPLENVTSLSREDLSSEIVTQILLSGNLTDNFVKDFFFLPSLFIPFVFKQPLLQLCSLCPCHRKGMAKVEVLVRR